jgi:hypothetical protein
MPDSYTKHGYEVDAPDRDGEIGVTVSGCYDENVTIWLIKEDLIKMLALYELSEKDS